MTISNKIRTFKKKEASQFCLENNKNLVINAFKIYLFFIEG